MSEDQDVYFLANTETAHTDNDGHVMYSDERRKRNEFLERQQSKWRWMTKTDIEALKT